MSTTERLEKIVAFVKDHSPVDCRIVTNATECGGFELLTEVVRIASSGSIADPSADGGWENIREFTQIDYVETMSEARRVLGY